MNNLHTHSHKHFNNIALHNSGLICKQVGKQNPPTITD